MTRKLRLGIISLAGLVAAGALWELPHAGRQIVSNLVITQDVSQLTQASDLVVNAVVKKKMGTVREDDGTGQDMVYTRWLVSPVRHLKGSAKNIVVRTDGGQYLTTIVDVEDSVTLTVGDSVLLFLRAIPGTHGEYQIAGSFQGAYQLKGSQAVQYGSNKARTASDLTAEIQQTLN